jgi:hypothetical protein
MISACKKRGQKNRLCQKLHRNRGTGIGGNPEPEGEAVQGVLMMDKREEKIKARDVMGEKEREMPEVRPDLV